MRNDMFKVIVERPRRGGGFHAERRTPIDEDSPARESLRWRHVDRKWLNENLRPLERYLRQQVGRPWDKVFSEICQGIDRRNTVQQHIHQHLGDYVAVKVVVIDGIPCEPTRWGEMRPLESAWASRFYVDPCNGLLRANKARERTRKEQSARQMERRRPPAHRRELSPLRQLHRLGGIWYEVGLAPLTDAAVFDVVWGKSVLPDHAKDSAIRERPRGNAVLYGRHGVYATHKRQLSARELREHGLHNGTE